MDSRERVGRALSGRDHDRVPYQDVFWKSTIQRWRREGLPEDVDLADFFGCEITRIGGDYSMQFPQRTLEETSRYRIYVDRDGATRKEIAQGDDWTPHWLDFTIRSADDWRRHHKRMAYSASRIAPTATAAWRHARDKGRFVAFSAHASFHPTWHKIGLETMLTAMIDEPDWPVDMMAAHAQLIIDLYEGMKAEGFDFDGAWLSDDLGYNRAPLVSPAMYEELIMPHHRRLCEYFAADGLPVILHSDGDVRPLIPLFLDAGITALHPLEAKAGLHVADLSTTYGDRLDLFGNIDVTQLAGSAEAVVAEVEATVAAGMAGAGGYLFHSDHSVPSDVSLENYRLALQTLRRVGNY
jgi:uroporphyrinogen decarboxylase